MNRIVFLMITGAVLATATGCSGKQRKWEVTVENKSDAPCSFFFKLDAGNVNAKVEDVAKGKPIILIVGDQPTTVNSVRIVCGTDEQTLLPGIGLPLGKRYAVVVGEDGKAQGSVSDR